MLLQNILTAAMGKIWHDYEFLNNKACSTLSTEATEIKTAFGSNRWCIFLAHKNIFLPIADFLQSFSEWRWQNREKSSESAA